MTFKNPKGGVVDDFFVDEGSGGGVGWLALVPGARSQNMPGL